MAKDSYKVKFSIRIKLFLAIFGFAVLLSAFTLTVSYFVYRSTSETAYGNSALNLARTQASAVNVEDVKAVKNLVLPKFYEIYEENGNKLPELTTEEEINAHKAKFSFVTESTAFKSLQTFLDDLYQDNSVSSVYIGFIDNDLNAFIYLCDSKFSDDYCLPGSFDTPLVSEQSDKIKDLPAKDQILEPYSTESDTYGNLISSAAPILDGDNLICHAYVDIDFKTVLNSIQRFINILGLGVLIFTLVITGTMVFIFDLTLVRPIRKLDKATESYLNNNETTITESPLAKLNINTKDEVEHLTNSIRTLEKSISSYIDSIRTISAEQERYSTELYIAEKIQTSILPQDFPKNENYELEAYMNPAKEVGGDFYDFFMVDETHIALVIADVSGKGIPAALFMAIGKTLIKDHTRTSKNLSETFTDVNELLSQSNTADMFITAYEGVLDLETGEYKFVNAGHVMPFIYKKKAKVFETYRCKPGFVLAGMPGIKYQEGQLKLEPGDKIFLYTDGIPEATNEAKLQYGMGRLQRVLKTNKDKNTAEIIDFVNEDLNHFVQGATQFDDVTMLCFEFKNKIEGRKQVLEVGANLSNFAKVLDFVNNHLDSHYVEKKTINKIDIALDELFSNICNYAYEDGLGKVTIEVAVTSKQIRISLIDDGKKYNPLEHDDPDITESVKDRQIGGLGIMMVKKTMDEVTYEYKHKQNIITIIKKIEKE